MKLDVEKFATYSKPGPRYTSYPTANEFHDQFSYESYLEALSSVDPKTPLSLYLHLPFCRSACYFCGCNVIYTSKQEKKSRYIEYLSKELALLDRWFQCKKEVVQFHLGGGTPTFMSAAELKEIFSMIHGVFPNFAKDSENSCEVDPRFFTREQMQVLASHGINRLSFGVQDFDISVQEAIHRVQSQELVKETVQLAREFGIDSINFDLIYGLPKQNLESFKKTLDMVVSMQPDRLAIFNYAHVPWLKKSMRKINEHDLPSPAEKLRILEYSIAFLQDQGYEMIGMDHFAKPNDELCKALKRGELRRNFQGYTTKQGSQTLGIGVTSIGEGETYYAQNHKDLGEYERSLDSGRLPLAKGILLNEEDRLRKYVIMQLMSNFSVNYTDVKERFSIDFKNHFDQELKELKAFEEAKLLELCDDALTITAEGTLLVRNLVMPFDSFLRRSPSEMKRFSKTV